MGICIGIIFTNVKFNCGRYFLIVLGRFFLYSIHVFVIYVRRTKEREKSIYEFFKKQEEKMIKPEALGFLIGYFVLIFPITYAIDGTLIGGLCVGSMGIIFTLFFNKLWRDMCHV